MIVIDPTRLDVLYYDILFSLHIPLSLGLGVEFIPVARRFGFGWICSSGLSWLVICWFLLVLFIFFSFLKKTHSGVI
jgi:hypothetical protein